jgi:hypothetical protein
MKKPPLTRSFDNHGAAREGGAFRFGIRVVLDHSCQVQRHTLTERGDDAYFTPPCATETLLRHVTLPHRLWECACGDGTGILDVLRAHGHTVIGSDLIDYGRPDCFSHRDFLFERKVPDGCEAIITNPPYKLAEQFVAHAIELSPVVVMLLRLAFFEAGTGRAKRHLLRARVLDETPPARILVFRKRLPMMHRRTWKGRKGNSGMAFCWIVWDRFHKGPTTIERISWEKAPATRVSGAVGVLTAPRVDSVSDWPDIPDFLRRVAP